MSGERVYTVWTPFGGCGGGALGFQAAEAKVKGVKGRFRLLGGIDIDRTACDTFHYLTGVEQLCEDIRKMTPERLRALIGDVAPDVIVGSAPCQASSKLITNEKAKEPHYEALNELTLVMVDLIFQTWEQGPAIMIFENVPNIRTRARKLLEKVRKKLRARGYLIHDEAHELGKFGHYYDAGQVAGLAQARERWLMVARDPKRVPAPLHLPPPLRHRTVGEVLELLPLPNDPAGGPMHLMPQISGLNWLRLALIPAGGDHRDLPGVLAEHQKRREVFRRYHVSGWGQTAPTVGGAGSNGPWGVCDPRVKCKPFAGAYGVVGWNRTSNTISASGQIDNSRVSVADPRVEAGGEGWWKGVLGVVPWARHAGTITQRSGPTNGAFSVADPRIPRAYDRGYGVLDWDDVSPTVAAGSAVGQGAYAVAERRIHPPLPFPAIGPISLDEMLVMLEQPGPWAIVDRSKDGEPVLVIDDVEKKLSVPLIIMAADGTWHRPFTPLELACIQGFPSQVRGKPLCFAGSGSTKYREQIGNAIPPGAMLAVGQMVLRCLLQSELNAYEFGVDGGFWVQRRARELAAQRRERELHAAASSSSPLPSLLH